MCVSIFHHTSQAKPWCRGDFDRDWKKPFAGDRQNKIMLYTIKYKYGTQK